jgi:Fe-S-cluster-containing dehydrogenase component/DMSO reductase anchor subunit
MSVLAQPESGARSLIDSLLEEQRDLTAVERFAQWHDLNGQSLARAHRSLVPLTAPKAGEQYAFEVDLDRCSGCKSCVTSCHALNGLDEGETWRSVGLLHGRSGQVFQQTITTACHHCVDPACLTGCPVLAYDKDPLTGIVRHLDDQCIGCQYCIFMCPYEVPKYSEQRGIVRKCDMCHQRLAHGEAPACVQACPSEAIRITVVNKNAVLDEYRDSEISKRLVTSAVANKFLPGSPEPAITLPTTRYISARPLPVDVTAGDDHEMRLQPAHAPLVWMLVLTQLGAGGFCMLPIAGQMAQPALAALALISTLLGLGGSILHLGRPHKAWRVFLGLRRSWLSREIVAFGMFALLGMATTGSLILKRGGLSVHILPVLTAFVGLAAVLCSGMTYLVTKRECWRAELSVGGFLGTTILLGGAAAWVSAVSSGEDSRHFAFVVLVATVVKLSREFSRLRLCPDDADFNEELPADLRGRGAFLMRFRIGGVMRFRLACAWLGGVLLPLLSLLSHSNAQVIAPIGFLLCLAGESAERVLFFRTAVVPKMPGGVIA